MQPYVNPNYFQFQQPQMNPYQQRMEFLQSYQQNLQQPMQPIQNGLNGKVVSSVEVITANDVPMDGSVAVFPKQDMSEIYVKFWENNGTIRTIVFKPILEPSTNNLSSEAEKPKFDLSEASTTAFMERFDSLEKQINDLMTKSMTKTAVSKTKKESEVE